jgi:hypothetical protein
VVLQLLLVAASSKNIRARLFNDYGTNLEIRIRRYRQDSQFLIPQVTHKARQNAVQGMLGGLLNGIFHAEGASPKHFSTLAAAGSLVRPLEEGRSFINCCDPQIYRGLETFKPIIDKLERQQQIVGL